MLHKRSDVDDLTESISRLAGEIHKYRFPDVATDRRAVFEVVAQEIALDGNAHQNLATFCQTWESEEAMRLMALSINKNLIDKDEYPQAAEIERLREAVRMIAPTECVECEGSGSLGRAQGKEHIKIACDSCGGHEDALGRGYIENQDVVYAEWLARPEVRRALEEKP